MVTFSTSSLTTSSPGGGRKSSTIFTAPAGPLVYLILLLIDSLTFGPVACPEDADDSASVRETNSQNSATITTVAIVAFLSRSAVFQILREDAAPIQEGNLGFSEADPVLLLIGEVLARVPLEGERHEGSLP